MKKVDKNYMFCLSFEMTRKCNMDCIFCARGKAQNIDITKEIIDKTLDEIQDVFIYVIRLNGGEPLLNPDMIEYLVDEIINRHILVSEMAVFTNGTVRNETVKKAFRKFSVYRESINDEINYHLARNSDIEIHHVYKTEGKGIGIIISTNLHDCDISNIRKTKDFYSLENTEYYSTVIQSDVFSHLDTVTISGNAEDNIKEIVGNIVSIDEIRTINNKYNFIRNFINSDYCYVEKTISVSANGNVFPGCLMDYNKVDCDYMFNIQDCNGNFIKKIIDWCWQYPVNKKINMRREIYNAIKFCMENGIKVRISKKVLALWEAYDIMTIAQEKNAREIHEKVPMFNSVEVDTLSTALLVNDMFKNGVDIEVIKTYLKYYSEYDADTIKNINLKWVQGFIDFFAEKAKKIH